jgi:hypothetical protein
MERENFSKSVVGVAMNSTAISTAAAQTSSIWIDTLGFDSLLITLYISAYASGAISGISFNGSNLASHSDSVALDDHFALYQPGVFPLAAGPNVIQLASIAKTRYVQLVVTTSNPTVSMTLIAFYALQDAFANPPVINSSVVTAAQLGGGTTEGDAPTFTFPKR